MKTFRVEGWHRRNDEKEFETLYVECKTAERALILFKDHYAPITFYKIEIKQTA